MTPGTSWQPWEQRVGRGPNLGTCWNGEEGCLALSLSLPPASTVALGKSLPSWMPRCLACNMGGDRDIRCCPSEDPTPPDPHMQASVRAAPLHVLTCSNPDLVVWLEKQSQHTVQQEGHAWVWGWGPK